MFGLLQKERKVLGGIGMEKLCQLQKNCLVATLWDYEKILKIVLRFDRAARKWFRRNVKSIVIDENGLTLGDFILPNDIVDYEKAREHDHMILGLDNK